jgi:uncharacterized membrane protein
MRSIFSGLKRAVWAVRPWRLFAVLLVSVVVGLVCDWFRAEQRLVFERPLPVFHTTSPGK